MSIKNNRIGKQIQEYNAFRYIGKLKGDEIKLTEEDVSSNGPGPNPWSVMGSGSGAFTGGTGGVKLTLKRI